MYILTIVRIEEHPQWYELVAHYAEYWFNIIIFKSNSENKHIFVSYYLNQMTTESVYGVYHVKDDTCR